MPGCKNTNTTHFALYYQTMRLGNVGSYGAKRPLPRCTGVSPCVRQLLIKSAFQRRLSRGVLEATPDAALDTIQWHEVELGSDLAPFHPGLFGLHSQLLTKSWLISFPPLSNKLKSGGCSGLGEVLLRGSEATVWKWKAEPMLGCQKQTNQARYSL